MVQVDLEKCRVDHRKRQHIRTEKHQLGHQELCVLDGRIADNSRHGGAIVSGSNLRKRGLGRVADLVYDFGGKFCYRISYTKRATRCRVSDLVYCRFGAMMGVALGSGRKW